MLDDASAFGRAAQGSGDKEGREGGNKEDGRDGNNRSGEKLIFRSTTRPPPSWQDAVDIRYQCCRHLLSVCKSVSGIAFLDVSVENARNTTDFLSTRNVM